MSFTICLDGAVCWAAGRSPLLPAFTAVCRSPPYSPSTMPTYNRWILQSVRTSSAIPTRVSVRTAPERALHRVGLTRGHLRYRRPVSLAMPDEISCGGRRLRSLMHRCTKTLRSRNDGRLRLEWKLITSSTIRILAFPVIHKARFPWEATGMPSSRMRREISPLTPAKSLPPPAPAARSNWPADLRSEGHQLNYATRIRGGASVASCENRRLAPFSPGDEDDLNGDSICVRFGADPRRRGIHALPRPAARQRHAPSSCGSYGGTTAAPESATP